MTYNASSSRSETPTLSKMLCRWFIWCYSVPFFVHPVAYRERRVLALSTPPAGRMCSQAPIVPVQRKIELSTNAFSYCLIFVRSGRDG